MDHPIYLLKFAHTVTFPDNSVSIFNFPFTKNVAYLYQGCGVGGKISDYDLSKISDSRLRLSEISDSDLSIICDSDSLT